MSTTTIHLSPDVLNSIVETWQNMVASSYTSAAGLTANLYDLLLTLSEEKELIWNRKMSPVSVLYLINRYLSLPILLMYNYHISLLRGKVSDNFCRANIIAYAITWGMCLAISTWLLSLRVISLWHRNKWVVWSLYIAFGACHISEWVITGYSLYYMYPSISYFGGVKVCGANSVELIGAAYFTVIGLEVYVLVLQLTHHYLNTRAQRRHNMPTFTLIRTLYNDGYIYFIIAVSFRLLTCLVWVFGPGSLWYLTNEIEFAMTVSLASRFHLHLKRVASGPAQTQNEYPMVTGDRLTHPDDFYGRAPNLSTYNTTAALESGFAHAHSSLPPHNPQSRDSIVRPKDEVDRVPAIHPFQDPDSTVPLGRESMSWLGLARTRSSKDIVTANEERREDVRVVSASAPQRFSILYDKEVDQLELNKRRQRVGDLDKRMIVAVV